MTPSTTAAATPAPVVHLVHGDSTRADTLLAHLTGQVALVVTSPPYWNAIDYEGHATDRASDWRARHDEDYASVYLRTMADVWAACRRLLRPGGHLVINAGTVLVDGIQYPLPQDLLTDLLATGDWEYVRTVTWNKVTAGVKRAGTLMQRRRPGYWYPNILTEHILVLRVPGGNPVLNTATTPPEWWEPVWDIAPVPPRTVDHPAPFPEEIPHRFTAMLTRPGDTVLDPFNGAGTTVRAATDLGRNAAGVDLKADYLATTTHRLLTGTPAVRPNQLRIEATDAATFVPKTVGAGHGKTRHGAGRGRPATNATHTGDGDV